MYFHTDDPEVIAFIAAVAQTAVDTGTRLRLDVDGHGDLRIKRGEGMWTAPFYSTPDPYRDLGQAQHESHDLSRFEP